MSDHIDPTPTSSPLGVVDEILAVIAAEDPHGATAAQVARAIGLGFDGTVVQDTLEELVEQGGTRPPWHRPRSRLHPQPDGLTRQGSGAR